MSLVDGADFKEFVAEKLSVLLQQSPAAVAGLVEI